MISNMLTMHECVVLTVMQKLLIVWTCYLLVISLYTIPKQVQVQPVLASQG